MMTENSRNLVEHKGTLESFSTPGNSQHHCLFNNYLINYNEVFSSKIVTHATYWQFRMHYSQSVSKFGVNWPLTEFCFLCLVLGSRCGRHLTSGTGIFKRNVPSDDRNRLFVTRSSTTLTNTAQMRLWYDGKGDKKYFRNSSLTYYYLVHILLNAICYYTPVIILQ